MRPLCFYNMANNLMPIRTDIKDQIYSLLFNTYQLHEPWPYDYQIIRKLEKAYKDDPSVQLPGENWMNCNIPEMKRQIEKKERPARDPLMSTFHPWQIEIEGDSIEGFDWYGPAVNQLLFKLWGAGATIVQAQWALRLRSHFEPLYVIPPRDMDGDYPKYSLLWFAEEYAKREMLSKADAQFEGSWWTLDLGLYYRVWESDKNLKEMQLVAKEIMTRALEHPRFKEYLEPHAGKSGYTEQDQMNKFFQSSKDRLDYEKNG